MQIDNCKLKRSTQADFAIFDCPFAIVNCFTLPREHQLLYATANRLVSLTAVASVSKSFNPSVSTSMVPDGNGSNNGARGLPPVTPPSGRFIVQLFLVPGLIVALAVLILLGFRYLVGGSHTAAHFLEQLKSDNLDIRWRGASDLAQVLKRPESTALRSDAKFALDLADRLKAALEDLNRDEQATHERIKDLTAEKQQQAWIRFNETKRPLAQFLIAALGEFNVAVGVPILSEVALHAESPDQNGNANQRRIAVLALGNLGDNLKGFKKLEREQQAASVAVLEKEAGGSGLRARGARNALFYLKKTDVPPSGIVAVDRVLEQCSRDEDRYLRVLVALAINFWDSPLVEPTLLRLARDDGFGTLRAAPENP
jgi:hypothetical protein